MATQLACSAEGTKPEVSIRSVRLQGASAPQENSSSITNAKAELCRLRCSATSREQDHVGTSCDLTNLFTSVTVLSSYLSPSSPEACRECVDGNLQCESRSGPSCRKTSNINESATVRRHQETQTRLGLEGACFKSVLSGSPPKYLH